MLEIRDPTAGESEESGSWGLSEERLGRHSERSSENASERAERAAPSALVIRFDLSFSRCDGEVKLLDFLSKNRNLFGITYCDGDGVL